MILMKIVSEKKKKSFVRWVALAIAALMLLTVVASAVIGVFM